MTSYCRVGLSLNKVIFSMIVYVFHEESYYGLAVAQNDDENYLWTIFQNKSLFHCTSIFTICIISVKIKSFEEKLYHYFSNCDLYKLWNFHWNSAPLQYDLVEIMWNYPYLSIWYHVLCSIFVYYNIFHITESVILYFSYEMFYCITNQRRDKYF